MDFPKDFFTSVAAVVNGRHSSASAASIRKFLLAVCDQAVSIFDGRI
jgi:hypothetical protein